MQKWKTNAQGKVNQPTISAEKKQKAIVCKKSTLQAFTGIEHAQFPPNTITA